MIFWQIAAYKPTNWQLFDRLLHDILREKINIAGNVRMQADILMRSDQSEAGESMQNARI